MSALFPSAEWFRALADRMAAQPEKYRKLGGMKLTLAPRITFPDGRDMLFSLEFDGNACRGVGRVDDPARLGGHHPVILEGDYGAWREMIENIRVNGHADLRHTLNYLTLPDWPFRLVPVDEHAGQLDVDRFYRYNETLQEFFDEAAQVDTRFIANGG
jgi:hypothetical protein